MGDTRESFDAADGVVARGPPDTRGNIQRIFVPKSALEEMSVLAVIGRPEARRKAVSAEDARQERLFTEQ